METPSGLATVSTPMTSRQAVALGETSGPSNPDQGSGGGDTGGTPDEDALQARLDALRRG